MHKDKLKKISKFLSFVLRHNPQSIGLELDNNGWAKIDLLIEKSKQIKLTRNIIDDVVKQNSKQRFIIENNKIRANQGHSIEIDLNLKAVTPPKILYHGTATRFLDAILKEGLSKQQRQYVHLSAKKETALEVGKRHGKVVILEIDTHIMLEENFSFFLSENNVWLCDSVPSKFLKIDKS